MWSYAYDLRVQEPEAGLHKRARPCLKAVTTAETNNTTQTQSEQSFSTHGRLKVARTELRRQVSDDATSLKNGCLCPALPLGATVTTRPKLLLLAMAGSMVLMQLGSWLMFVVHATTRVKSSWRVWVS